MSATTITLSKTIVFAKQEVAALELREARAGDLRLVPLSGRTVADNLNLASVLSGLHVHLLDLMAPVDLAAVNKTLNEILEPIMAAAQEQGVRKSDTYTLKTPLLIEGRDEPVTALTFREPIARDLRGLPLDASPLIGHLLNVGGRLCGCDAVVMDKLEIPDLGEVLSIVAGFILAGPGMPMTP